MTQTPGASETSGTPINPKPPAAASSGDVPDPRTQEFSRELGAAVPALRYDPGTAEKVWQDFWRQSQTYAFNPDSGKPIYTIDTPPPTVSGKLHLGHIFSYTQAEAVARYLRMSGYEVRYPMGFDNNGLPTERLVEKETGLKGHATDRAEFVRACLAVTEQYGERFRALWDSVGLSVDWDLSYSTISPSVQGFVQDVFRKLAQDGRIYRSNAAAPYCCECRTGVAQAELERKPKDGVFYDVNFKLADGAPLTIATTRPELLPACVAVMVNPTDERYQHLVGSEVTTPLGTTVKILADEAVLKDKGTGAVMCCTFGDETDLAWVKAHNLPTIPVLGKDGRFQNVESVPEMNGLSVKEGRRLIVEKLRESDSIVSERPLTHEVAVHERCGTPVEIIQTAQWYLRMLDMKEAMIEAGSQIEWHPSHMEKRFQEWVNGLQWDWAISRERFYGIPVPTMVCDSCDSVQVLTADEVDAHMTGCACSNCGTGVMQAEQLVLDTWFTSSLTPNINAMHRLNGDKREEMLPHSLRPHAHDIIRTWTTYSILMSLLVNEEVPFRSLMISGHVLSKSGEKVSKKTGGGKVEPAELISANSADAVRYGMFSAALGNDGYFDDKQVDQGKKLASKIFNAGKLILPHLADFDASSARSTDFSGWDRWIVARSYEVAEQVKGYMDRFEVSNARRVAEEFFWGEFCDDYLELAKVRLYGGDGVDPQSRHSAQSAAYVAYLNSLKMLAPFIPHITEHMYHADGIRLPDNSVAIAATPEGGVFARGEGVASVHRNKWPEQSETSASIEDGAALARDVLSEGRRYKAQNKLGMSRELESVVVIADGDMTARLEPFLADLQRTLRAKTLSIVAPSMEIAEEPLKCVVDLTD